MAAFRDLPLEEGRCGLLRWISNARPKGSMNNQVTVVFDGHPDQSSMFPVFHAGDSQNTHDIRVIFSDGCSADDQIKLMVDENVQKKNCVVVSDDKDVFLYARSLGARVMNVREFISLRTIARVTLTEGKYISLSHQEKINKEFFQRWLGDNQ